MTILGIDPGRDKCGIAVMGEAGEILHRAIVPTAILADALAPLVTRFAPAHVVLGGGTGSKTVADLVRTRFPDLPIHLVDERMTTLLSRARYWEIHPPKGLWKLLPRSLLVPPVPYDDCVAVILCERFLAARKNG